MNLFSLRAREITKDGQYVSFTAADIPVLIREGTIALFKRPYSTLLAASTLEIGSDIGAYVGDIITCEEEIGKWVVDYRRGFIATRLGSGEVRSLGSFKDFKVIAHATEEEMERALVQPKTIAFKYKGTIFYLDDILGMYQNKMIVHRINELVPEYGLEQDTSITVGDQRLFLGDTFRGYPIILCYGRVCIQDRVGAYDLLQNQYIIK